jgi:ornithine cyclodeaminase
MTAPVLVPFEAEERLDWLALTDALAEGHRRPEARLEDVFLRRGEETILSRAAWIDGLGALVKTATIWPGNRDAPPVNGAVTLFSDADGTLEAVLDFHLVTKWKTAADSLLAARRLARPDAREVLIVGAGTVAASLREAYGAAFPEARFRIWNRTPARAEALAARHPGTEVAADLAAAVAAADIVTVATMSSEPVIRGAWLRPGTHLDLIGAYRADMREADDAAIAAGRLFVDARATVLGHIGELRDPLARGVLSEADVIADYRQLDRFERLGCEVTVFKNGGGAHLDLMTARHILERWGGPNPRTA